MSEHQGHERQDAPPALVLGGIAGLLGLIVVGALIAWILTVVFRAKEPVVQPSAFDRAASAHAAPRLEIDAAAARIRLEDQARDKLKGYAWVDRNAGLARIPIARAMAIEAARGWPDSDASSAPASAAAPVGAS